MLTLITGTPGAGKTAWAVKQLCEVKDRPVFVMGIRDLKLPHEPVPPVDEWTEMRPIPEDPKVLQPWFRFPANSLIVIDEAQNVYRPRPVGSKVPDIVAALETHRHTGIDIWLITQHPNLIDTNVRRLIRRHVHVRVTPFGRFKHEWSELGDPDSKLSRDLSRTDRYKLPKEVYSLYRSAEAHTVVHARKPLRFYIMIVAVLALAALGYRIVDRVRDYGKPADVAQVEGTQKLLPGQPGQAAAKVSPAQYAAAFEPRVLGRPETAPIYDAVTVPKSVPVAVACYESERTGCKCITQQGTRYETSEQVCKTIIAQGDTFKPWKPDDAPNPRAEHAAPDVRPEVDHVSGVPLLSVPRFVDAAAYASGGD